MTASGGDRVLHYPTHAELVEPTFPTASPPGGALDAIIVPAARPADNLRTAIGLATETGARLVVLCSFRTHADEVRALLAERPLKDAVVVEVPQDHDSWILRDLETTRFVHDGRGKGVCGGRKSDLSIKRNAGLLLARMLGWDRIFFLDDDIREVWADTVLSTAGLLGAERGYRTAGMSVKVFADNSVVCHARREVGESQDVFVSGSVLAVNCQAPFDFFPDLYNEDWLFFHRDAAAGRLATPGSLAEQLPYDPYADPQRAAGQEFGDVIAEGLYALLHRRLGIEAATEDYWRQFLKQRSAVLEDVSRKLSDWAPGKQREKISKAIGSAQQVLWTISADMCVEYLAAWQRDLERWEHEVLAKLPREVASISEALLAIGLS